MQLQYKANQSVNQISLKQWKWRSSRGFLVYFFSCIWLELIWNFSYRGAEQEHSYCDLIIFNPDYNNYALSVRGYVGGFSKCVPQLSLYSNVPSNNAYGWDTDQYSVQTNVPLYNAYGLDANQRSVQTIVPLYNADERDTNIRSVQLKVFKSACCWKMNLVN